MQHNKLPQQNRIKYIGVRVKGTIFNATFRNISVMSWRLALLVEETGVPGKKTTDLSHYVVSNTPRQERGLNS